MVQVTLKRQTWREPGYACDALSFLALETVESAYDGQLRGNYVPRGEIRRFIKR